MDLTTGDTCAVCGASFPESWKRPVYFNHEHPGRDWGQCQQATPLKRPQFSHWISLHQYPVEHWEDWNPRAAKSWFDSWRSRIPNYGCACRDNFDSYLVSHSPDYTSADTFFEWAVEAHNYVSLNHVQPPKPSMPLDEARKLRDVPAEISQTKLRLAPHNQCS